MLETVDSPKSLPKDEYKRRKSDLQRRLLELQRAAHAGGIASMVVCEGWRTSGRSSVIKKLTERLEPRGFTLHSIREARSHEAPLPWMWRFWCRTPRRGEMAIFHRSWNHELIEELSEGSIDHTRWLRKCRDVRFFEDALTNDRCLITKFFFHIGEEEQRKRLEKMAANPDRSWLLTDADWHRHELYAKRRIAVEETLQQTEAEWGPWSLINTTDRYWARVRVFEVLIQRMEEGLERLGVPIEDFQL